jgi:outer membrane protein assembly factor BamB
VHINTVCPFCLSQFRLQPELRGQTIACPNPRCREPFTVEEVVEGKGGRRENGERKAGRTGSVSDLIPLLPAEEATPDQTGESEHVTDLLPLEMVQAEEAPAQEGPREATWHDQPPPVRGTPAPSPEPGEPPARRTKKKPRDPDLPPGAKTVDWRAAPPPVGGAPSAVGENGPEADAPPDVPRERRADAGKPAPVRRSSTATTDAEDHPGTPTHHEDAEELALAKKRRRRARLLMAGMALVVLMVLGGAGSIALFLLSQTEERLAARASDAYAQNRFSEAADRYRFVADKHPESNQHDEYLFMADLAQVRAALAEPSLEAEKALAQVKQFLADYRGRPEERKRLQEHARELGTSLVKRVDRFLEQQEPRDDRALDNLIKQTSDQLAELNTFSPGAVKDEERKEIGERAARLKAAIEKLRESNRIVARLMAFKAKPPSSTTIRKARDLIRQQARGIPGLEEDPRTKEVLEVLYKGHRESIRYVEAGNEKPARLPREDTEPGILLDPLVAGVPRPNDNKGQVVLALVRGVLYVMDAATGQTLWALRVGIDTARLPVRLPPTPAHPGGRLLVLSADTHTLRTFDLRGQLLWAHRLGAASLGRPVLIDRRGTPVAYVATADGQVHEIELAQGTLRGSFRLNSPMSVGGVHQKGTNLVYFPADDFCVYILDVEKKTCEGILYTEHPSGSLRGEPLILPGNAGIAGVGPLSDYLLLSLADGLDATALRLYRLPISNAHAGPEDLQTPARIRGWSWFTPHQDPEKLALLSDAGRLGLFGIRQANNRDSPLFPLIPRAEGNGDEDTVGIDLAGLLGMPPGKEVSRERARALVAHAQGDDLWVLAYGRLQHLTLGLVRRSGPSPLALWDRPLVLGSPLHGPQVLESPGGLTLYLVTRPLSRPVCLVTAVDPEAPAPAGRGRDPRILWQRQLGMVCQGAPVVLGGELVAQDQGGGLYRFDPGQFKTEVDGQWQVGGQAIVGAGGLAVNQAFPPLLLRGAGDVVYQVSTPGAGTDLVVRAYQALPAGASGARPVAEEGRATLPGAALAGTPIIVNGSLVVALDDGRLVRYSLPLRQGARHSSGPNWRSRRAVPGAPCYLAALGGDEFVSTDGRRGLIRWRWPPDGPCEAILPSGRRGDDPVTAELPDRIVVPPLALPGGMKEKGWVLVADLRGTLTLLEGKNLAPVRTWELGGTITAGPFLRGSHAGCIVDGTRLVWINPAQTDRAWEYTTSAGAIVGKPALVDGVLVVCDEGGQFAILDPKTGKQQGTGYKLKAAVAPAASPVAFGKSRIFAPLTDGTILLLSLEKLRGK